MKGHRQKFITDMVTSGAIRSQSEIVQRLRKKGFEVTQASVSRDLEAMGIRKQKGVYRTVPLNGMLASIGKVSLQKSGDSLVVAKCDSGLASALAVQLDALKTPEIIGTLAGDDTVFIAVKNASSQSAVFKGLKERFGG